MQKDGDGKSKERKTYNPEIDDYVSMAHYVGKVLKIRPSEILDTWSVPELIVAFGIYRNEQQEKSYQEIESHNKYAKGKDKLPKIDKYAVKFYTREEMEEMLDRG